MSTKMLIYSHVKIYNLVHSPLVVIGPEAGQCLEMLKNKDFLNKFLVSTRERES